MPVTWPSQAHTCTSVCRATLTSDSTAGSASTGQVKQPAAAGVPSAADGSSSEAAPGEGEGGTGHCSNGGPPQGCAGGACPVAASPSTQDGPPAASAAGGQEQEPGQRQAQGQDCAMGEQEQQPRPQSQPEEQQQEQQQQQQQQQQQLVLHQPQPVQQQQQPGEALHAALPALRDVLAALTASSANEGFSCEGAELVGDAVLEHLAAVHLFSTLRWGPVLRASPALSHRVTAAVLV